MMNWLRRLMYGRYGSDQLNNAILAFCVVLMVIQWFVHWQVLAFIMLILLVLCYIRMFSRNIQARYAENQRFLQVWNPIAGKLATKTAQFKDRKEHRYFKCPSCKTTLRIPRGRGKIEITCPKCQNKFVKKS